MTELRDEKFGLMPADQVSVEELIGEIRRLEREIPRPFVQVVTKMIRSKGKYYAYAYLQWREGKVVKTVYLGKQVPEDIAKRIMLQGRLKVLKKELRKRISGM